MESAVEAISFDSQVIDVGLVALDGKGEQYAREAEEEEEERSSGGEESGDTDDSVVVSHEITEKFLEKEQDQKLFQKLVKATNFCKFQYQSNAKPSENMNRLYKFFFQTIANKMARKEVYDIHFVTLTYDNRHILTIEKDKKDCAYVRCYILDNHAAEKEFLDNQYDEGRLSSNASVVTFHDQMRKQQKW